MQRPTSLSRRAVLLGGVVALPLSGCGIRLEDDAPDLPLVPQRTPVAGEAALLAMLASLRAERPAESVPAGAAAARAEGEEQMRLRSLVAGLEELLRLQTAAGDDDGSGAPLGYDLDDPLATAAERAALARTTLTTLTDRLVALLPSLDADRTAAHEIVAWAATTLALGQPWQLEIGTLPGYVP